MARSTPCRADHAGACAGGTTPATDVTGDDPVVTGKIALAHLNEFADYYTRLARMESEAKRDQEIEQ